MAERYGSAAVGGGEHLDTRAVGPAMGLDRIHRLDQTAVRTPH